MSNQPRATKVLISLVISMTIGAIVLMTLDSKSISGGAFSLVSYSALGTIKQAVVFRRNATAQRWERIEVFYSKTSGGNLEQLSSLSGLVSPEDINFHFLICNGLGGIDGQISTTEKWLRQWSSLPDGSWNGVKRTIRICVIASGTGNPPTGSQLTRTVELVEMLTRKFHIDSKNILYPADWQL